jgi:aminoglycoside phosphotransferase (APT) family kinase protein
VFFSYLEEAMAEQRSTHAPRIRRVRLRELCHILEDVCARLDATGLPTTVIHGDMNLGNILVGRSHCQLIDWAEACVGSPVTTLQHLLLLNHVQEESVRASLERDLKNHYRRVLLTICRAEQIDEAFLFMPLIAAFSALYGRGDWLASPLRGDPRRQQYARTLARHIDRAAQEPQLLSILRARRSPCTSDGRANAGRGRNRESES